MMSNEPMPLKNLLLWLLFCCCSIVVAYIFFVAFISIWIGFNHFEKDGFWVPVVAGIFSIVLVLLGFLRLSKSIHYQMKEKEILNY